ncbi:T9SS type A sorting domain-containing protein [Candidatus Zixiibacteriota bacterium]
MKSRIIILTLAVVGTLAVGALAETRVIEVMNFRFEPRNLTIAVGDVVRWEWGSGAHTTTNGLGSSAAEAGMLWDAPLNMSSQSFERQFNEVGDFPFFCRPHESADMKGTITVQLATGIFEESSHLPDRYYLAQNYPNPFNPVTQIAFSLPAAADATLKVYNILGEDVTTLIDENLASGEHLAEWDGRDANGLNVSTGVYFYRLTASEFVSTRKMVLLK